MTAVFNVSTDGNRTLQVSVKLCCNPTKAPLSLLCCLSVTILAPPPSCVVWESASQPPLPQRGAARVVVYQQKKFLKFLYSDTDGYVEN